MAIRMTGLISNMDTESIIKSLVSAQKLKNKKTTDKQTILTWQQEKWKDLNKKLYDLYTGDLSNMRLQKSYLTRAVTSSDEAYVTATGEINAAEGSHTLTVDKMASSQYVTGKKLLDADGNNLKEADGDPISGSSLLVSDLGMADGTQIKIQTSTSTKILDVGAKTTLNSFLQKCKDAGLNASYDAQQNRIFISSKSSGTANQFTITTFTDDGLTNKRNIDNLVGYSSLSSTNKAKVDAAYLVIKGEKNSTILNDALTSSVILDGDTAEVKAVKNAVATLTSFTDTYTKSQAELAATAKIRADMTDAIVKGTNDYHYADVDYTGVYAADTQTSKNELIKKYNNASLDFNSEPYKTELEKLVASKVDARVSAGITSDAAKALIKAEKDNILSQQATDLNGDPVTDAGGNPVSFLQYTINNVKSNISAYSAAATHDTTGKLSNLGLSDLTKSGDTIVSGDPDVTLIAASDSQITLNNAVLTGTSNVFTVNGLTLNLKALTEGKTITLNVSKDTNSIYNMVKTFVSSYNTILKELNTLYDAKSSRGYNPLSDEEKEAMTDDQVEKWETKIKDSMLRRDSTLGSVINSMRTALTSAVEVNGKKYTLSSYGIHTAIDYSEKGLLHIDGNKDDSVYKEDDDKLMKALENDPNKVMEVLTGISQKLYDAMDEKMSSIPNVRSKYSFNNDKLMEDQQTEYSKKIKILDNKLTAMEDRYYKQFSEMETALARMQSQQNALAGMLGS